jgi:NADH-dependent peroxiredoxin subunit C
MLKVGDKIPDIQLQAYHGGQIKNISLHDYLGKWLILIFYPADFTFVCPTELQEAAACHGDFKAEGAEILSVSTDTVFAHKAWHDTSPAIKNIVYPMLADPTGRMCREFGTYLEDEGLSIRATFIIDSEGLVKSMEFNDNSIGRNIRETLRKLQASKYVAKNKGKVCPASWNPGDETLTPGVGLVGKI